MFKKLSTDLKDRKEKKKKTQIEALKIKLSELLSVLCLAE